MTTYYLPRPESEWLDAHGGKDKLRELVREAMDPPTVVPIVRPALLCPHCGVRLQRPGDPVCFHCGLSIVVD